MKTLTINRGQKRSIRSNYDQIIVRNGGTLHIGGVAIGELAIEPLAKVTSDDRNPPRVGTVTMCAGVYRRRKRILLSNPTNVLNMG